MKYNTIIFDLDGTLLNTLDDLRDSLNDILSEKGYPAKTLEEVRSYIGDGVMNLIKRSLPTGYTQDEVNLLLEQFREHYKNNMQNKTRPYNGIMELLLDLHRYNYKIGIVSNKYDSAVKSLSRFFFGNIVSVAIGETNEVRRKPAPDSVIKAIQELDSDTSQTIFVGDSDTDVQTAKNAGIPCIGVTWGFRSREVLRTAGADYLIDTPKELFTYI